MADESPPRLTTSQIEILTQLANGYTYQQIAYRRKAQYGTVREQTKQARKLLGAETSMHMIALFVTHFPIKIEIVGEKSIG